jgi:hypothetical protein
LRWEKEASCSCVADATRARDASGISAAFNVSQRDRAPLDLLRETLECGTLRRAGNGGWYWEVNRLSDLSDRIVPFFDRFPIVGQKAEDYRLWRSAVGLLCVGRLSDRDYAKVLALRERMNRGGKETLSDARNPQRLYAEPASLERPWDEIVRSHGRP